MAERELNEYIRQNLAAGFPESEIRAALLQAGWQEGEIAEAFSAAKSHMSRIPGALARFFSKRQKAVLAVVIVLIVSPLITYGGLWTYNNVFNKKTASSDEAGLTTRQNLDSSSETEIAARDKQRLADIELLQTELDNYFDNNRYYPQNLAELARENHLTRDFADPKTDEPYLYTALGDPALNYSLTFILENNTGSLQAGLHEVSSEIYISARVIQRQQEQIQGENTESLKDSIEITDLSVLPFYPKEEIKLGVTAPPEIQLESTYLLVGDKDLTDRTAPFSFSFTAPAKAGEYSVKVFAFDEEGEVYLKTTQLTVVENAKSD